MLFISFQSAGVNLVCIRGRNFCGIRSFGQNNLIFRVVNVVNIIRIPLRAEVVAPTPRKMTDLVNEFNNLGGQTIAQHKQNFSRFSKKLSSYEPKERFHFLDNLQAKNRQEDIFLTKLLLKFEHKTKINELIRQGDRILNKLIVYHKPFVFRDDSIDFFIKGLFPNVSHIVRNKCLTNLAKSITRDDDGKEFFNVVLDKYGIKTAMPLLTVCSEAFIREIITRFRIVLREKQLVTLHQRFGIQFIDFYYAEVSKYGIQNHFADQPYFGHYLSTKDIQSFCQLIKYGIPHIGKTGFKNFLKVKKEDFLSDPKRYSTMMRRKIFYRFVSKKDFKRYFINKLPNNDQELRLTDHLDDLKLLPIGDRGNFMAEAFRTKYGFDIHQKYLKSEEYDFKAMLSALAIPDRLKFDILEDEMTEYFTPDKAFPLIKDRINLTSDINSRCELILKLFKCAKNNDNESALHDALKYFTQRHKNDQSSIRQDVFQFLQSNYKMEKLNAEIWKYIEELILTEEIVSEYQYMMRDMIEEMMLYKFVNGMDITALHKKLLKNMGCHYFILPTKNKALQKWALLHLPEVCAEIFPDAESRKKYPRAFMKILFAWNKENPKDIISYYKYPEFIDLAVQHNEGHYDDIIPKAIMRFKPEDPQERKKHTELLNNFEKFKENGELWIWLLHNRFDIIENQADLIFDKMSNIYLSFFYEVHKMHYTLLPGKIRAKALELLNEDKTEFMLLRKALTALSFEPDFLEIINQDKYYPTGEAEVNIHEENIKDMVYTRHHVIDCFKNRVRPWEIIEPLLRFCYKDYFQFALPVLTKVLFNLPEKDLMKPIAILQDRSVTVRKRALWFSTTLLNAELSCNSLKHAGETEKNKSLQKFIFNRTFKNFRFVCNGPSWELLMKHFKFVFEKDLETRDLVLQFNLIPRPYLDTYVAMVWKEIGKNTEKWPNEHNYILNFINADIMSLLSDELCDDIIHFTLVHAKDLLSSDVDFIYRYLLSGGDKINHRFDLVANNARVVADENCELDFKEFNKKSRNIFFLYNDLCRRLITDKDAHISEKRMLVNKLVEAFPNLPLPYNQLEYQMQIEICKCCLENDALLPDLLIKQQKEVIEKHGKFMIEYYNEFASKQVSLMSLNDNYEINLVQKLLERDNSTMVKLMAIYFMPNSYPANEETALHFRNLIEKIEAESAPVVSLYLNRYLKNMHI